MPTTLYKTTPSIRPLGHPVCYQNAPRVSLRAVPVDPLRGSLREMGNFVANFCQTMLNGTNSAAVLRGGGQRSGVREEEEETAKESAGNVVNAWVCQ